MYPLINYIKGIFNNLLNPRISLFAIVSVNSQIHKTACLYRFVKVNDAIIGEHSYLSASTNIENTEIGKYCSIADHCRIGMSSHSLEYLSTSPIFTQTTNALQECWIDKDVFEHKSEEERVYIGNDVWIGSHALVKGGVHIGNGACVAAGAVVVKDVPPYAIVGGVPAKVIRYRFPEEVIEKLQEIKWWELPDELLKENIEIFQNSNISDMEVLKRLNNIRIMQLGGGKMV